MIFVYFLMGWQGRIISYEDFILSVGGVGGFSKDKSSDEFLDSERWSLKVCYVFFSSSQPSDQSRHGKYCQTAGIFIDWQYYIGWSSHFGGGGPLLICILDCLYR